MSYLFSSISSKKLHETRRVRLMLLIVPESSPKTHENIVVPEGPSFLFIDRGELMIPLSPGTEKPFSWTNDQNEKKKSLL